MPPAAIGNSHAMTASSVPPVSSAWRAAQRSALTDDGEPSTPATIRGTLFALGGDISVSCSASALRGADDDHRTGRVVQAADADRADQRVDECAVTAVAHHEQIAILGRVEQHLGGVAFHDDLV